jgi:uncharacterized iron-regulated protein
MAVRALQDAPSTEHLALAQRAWRTARMAYLATEPLRFSGGPIDDDDGAEQEINAEKIALKTVDRLLDAESEFPLFTAEILRKFHQSHGSEDATCGFQVLAYLLWKSTAPPSTRVAKYLLVCAEILAEDEKRIATEWNVGEIGDFRTMFLEDPTLAVQRMITGASLMGAGVMAVRLQLALDAADETESCAPYSHTAEEETITSCRAILEASACLGPLLTQTQPATTAALARVATELKKTLTSSMATRQRIVALENYSTTLRNIGLEMGLHIPQEVGPEGE